MHSLIIKHAEEAGADASEPDEFFNELRTCAFAAAHADDGMTELLQPKKLMYIAVRLWTSALQFRGREFCSILNKALRDDNSLCVEPAATIVHALNTFCVLRRASGPPVRWPPSHVTYRGTAMPQCHRDFFTVGKKYRAPMFVATSFSDQLPVNVFLSRLPPSTADQTPPFQEPTLWRFHLDGSLPEVQRCMHANFIDRTDTTIVGSEDEFLYSPYSAYTVRAVRWHPSPAVNMFVSNMHEIDIDVAPDNKREPIDLPLAPWC